MEALPDLVLLHIATNLSGSELAAWCAVSCGWRDRLNHDDFWRHRCDSQIAEYLIQTPCLVQPCFINPQREDTGLSDIGSWRLAFMKETHLWNNWRNNRHYSVLLPNATNIFTHEIADSTPLLTYKNDYLIVGDKNEIQLWHVQQTAVKVCVKTLPSSELVSFWDLSGDCVAVKQSNQLQMFEISIAKAEFVLKHSVVTSHKDFCPILLFRSILVELESDTMQVWNTETGEMLKEEKRENTTFCTDGYSVTESYLALKAIRCDAGRTQFFFLVYRLPDVFPVFTSKLYDFGCDGNDSDDDDDDLDYDFEAVVLEDVIFIYANNVVDSYCLKTSQHIKRIDIWPTSNLERFFGYHSGNLVKLTSGLKKAETFQVEMITPGNINILSSEYFLSQQYALLSLFELEDEHGRFVKDLEGFRFTVVGMHVNNVKTKLVKSLSLCSNKVHRRLEVCSFW